MKRQLGLSALLSLLLLGSSFVIVGCNGGSGGDAGSGGAVSEGGDGAAGSLSGSIKIDGSSTVYPVSEAVAEEFRTEQPDIRVTVGFSGTGGGMKKFYAGEIDIADASREMKEKEAQKCAEHGVEFVRFSVAFDGLAIVLHPENTWCDCLTVAQLKELWRPESAVKTWKDLNPEWPNEEIHLFGPGTDSGTFDYFTEAICGESKASRADYTASEDDNVLVTGVQSDKYALGYFGFAYYAENKDALKLLAVDGGDGCVKPSEATVRDGSYHPLSRPLYIYVSKPALKRPEVKAFVEYYLANCGPLAKDVAYVPVSDEVAAENQKQFAEALK